MDGGAEFPGVPTASPNKIGVPLEVTVVVGLFAGDLGAHVDGFIEQAVGAARSADIKRNGATGATRTWKSELSGDGVGALGVGGIAFAYPAETKRSIETRSKLAIEAGNEEILANGKRTDGAGRAADDIQLQCANLGLAEIPIGGTGVPFTGDVLIQAQVVEIVAERSARVSGEAAGIVSVRARNGGVVSGRHKLPHGQDGGANAE